MQMSDAKPLAQKPAYLSVTKDHRGVWASTGAHALHTALQEQSSKGVMDLLKIMDARSMAQVCREAGFSVDSDAVVKGRNAVFESVKPELQKALNTPTQMAQTSAAATIPPPMPLATAQFGRDVSRTSMDIIRSVLSAQNVVVGTFGDTPISERSALQMIAGQALEKGILGFGFDGIPGKYTVTSSMQEVVELHRKAARSVATLSAKAALHSWSQESKDMTVHEFVPDSIQRLLQGSLSLDTAHVVVGALASGSIAGHAEELGDMSISNLLAERGLDVDAPTIQMQANELGLSFKDVDTERGMYFGAVVAQDHRASLIKVNKSEVIELTHQQSPLGKARVGEQLRIEFKAGVLKVASRDPERRPIER